MTLAVNSEMLEAAYEYLKTTPPFNKWNLPDGEDVKFKTSRRPKEYGRYQWDGEQHTITASTKSIGHTVTLMTFMAHEMIHLHLEEHGWETRRGGMDAHNGAFQKFATRVCECHGFDCKAFY